MTDFLLQFQQNRNVTGSREPGDSQTVPGGAPEGDRILDFQRARSLGTPEERAVDNVMGAEARNPDQVVEAEALSRDTGIPAQAVEQDPEVARRRAARNRAIRQIENDPVTTRFLIDPENAAVAQDSVDSLSLISSLWSGLKEAGETVADTEPEAVVQAFGSEAVRVVGTTSRGLGDLADAAGRRAVEDPGIAQAPMLGLFSRVMSGLTGLPDPLSPANTRARDQALLSGFSKATGIPADEFSKDLPDWLKVEPGSGLRAVGETIEEFADDIGPQPEDENFITDVAGGLGQLTTQITVALLTGGTGSVIQLAGQGAAIQSDLTPDEMKGTAEADFALFAGSGVTALTERFGLDNLLRRIPQSQRNKILRILAGAGSEASQEIIEGVMQNIVAVALHNPELELFDEGLLREGQVAGVVGGIASAIIPGRKAIATKEQVDDIKTAVDESPLTQRDPERAAQHNAAAMEEAGIDRIFIPAEQLREWTQNDPDLEASLGVTDQMPEALATGGDVQVTPGSFSRHVLGSDDFASISDHVRYGEDAWTKAEADDFAESGLEDEAARLGLNEDTTDAELAAEQEVDPEQAQQVRSFLDSEAERTGRTTDEVATLLGYENSNDMVQKRAKAVEDSSVLAEAEAGLQGLFRSAEEAGMTPKTYEQYLEAVARAADKTRKNQADKILREREKQLSEEWKTNSERVQLEVEEHLRQQPVYQALTNVGAERLDRRALAAVAEDVGTSLDALPKQSGKRDIYTSAATRKDGSSIEPGLDPEAYAEANGYDSAADMVLDLATADSFDDAVYLETDRRMRERFLSIHNQRQEIAEARRSLLHDDYGAVLARELNALRQAVKEKRVSHKQLKLAARRQMETHKVSDISADRYQAAARRAGRSTGRALRKGDRKLAAEFKLKQVLGFQMAVEAEKARQKVQKEIKFVRKFESKRKEGRILESLPLRHLDMIRELMSRYAFTPKLSAKKRMNLMEAAEREAEISGVPLEIPARVAREDSTLNYRDMALGDFLELTQQIRDIDNHGRQENRMLRADEKATRTENAERMADLVQTNIPNRAIKGVNPTMLEKLRKFGRQYIELALNMDSFAREVDGGEVTGEFYQLTKGRYDRAFSNGYHEGQIGVQRRRAQESRALTDLWSRHYSAKERKRMHKRLKIPGVPKPHSRADIVAVLLNSGNLDNRQALIDSGQYTDAQLQVIWDFADKKDWDFAQDVWNYLDNAFWNDITDATVRRQNRRPEKVEAAPIETRHGTYEGGYFPLRYSADKGIVQDETSLDALDQQLRHGQFVSSHTRDSHTKTREGSGGRDVMLDPFVLHTHVDQVVYDLEMGDAINDIYKVLTHKTFKQAMVDTGNESTLDAMTLWMADQSTGEVRASDMASKSFRYMRTGFTISKLGWNVGTIVLQPLGLLQSAAKLGKVNVMKGTMTVLTGHATPLLRGDVRGSIDAFEWVRSESPFMAARDDQYLADITEAQQVLSKTWANKNIPLSQLFFKDGLSLNESFFIGIKKLQKVVDTITWISAYRHGMDMFDGDREKTLQFADRQVAGSQASGIFGDRAALERGTTSRKHRQDEMRRSFTVLQSYFIAKLNVMSEVTQRTNFKNPASVLNWSIDMVMLFTVEAILAGLLRNQFPDDEDDDFTDVVEWTGKETANSVLATLPFVRELAGAARGFPGGGVFGAVVAEGGDLLQSTERAFSKGEIDTKFLKDLNNVLGIGLRYPSSQTNRVLEAAIRDANDEDVAVHEYFFGRPYKGN